jgi:hypothetical protein
LSLSSPFCCHALLACLLLFLILSADFLTIYAALPFFLSSFLRVHSGI